MTVALPMGVFVSIMRDSKYFIVNRREHSLGQSPTEAAIGFD
jgi:hypothetical protein